MNALENQKRITAILCSNYGVVFYKKNYLYIPALKKTYLNKFKQVDREHVEKSVSGLYKFLGGQPIGDQFGANQKLRREWRHKMRETFGQIFSDIYESNNQFRGNVIFMVRENIGNLVGYAKNNDQLDIVQALEDIHNLVARTLENYNYIESDQDKLNIIHLVENNAIKVLSLLAN